MKAFSLPELVAVIVIIGILVTLGVNQYRSFIAKGRQAEAKLNLKAIADLQESYKYENEEYSELVQTNGVGAFPSTDKCGGTNGKHMKNKLGFRPNNCSKLRYGYWWTGQKGNAKAYAESTLEDDKLIYPGCEKKDKWTLETKIKEMSQGSGDADSVIKKCE